MHYTDTSFWYMQQAMECSLGVQKHLLSIHNSFMAVLFRKCAIMEKVYFFTIVFCNCLQRLKGSPIYFLSWITLNLSCIISGTFFLYNCIIPPLFHTSKLFSSSFHFFQILLTYFSFPFACTSFKSH